MSLIPPVPLILSKMKYHILNRYKDDPDTLASVLEKLGPFYMFKLSASFRTSHEGETEVENIKEIIYSEVDQWDCIDTALNMLTRLKTNLKDRISEPGTLRTAIMFENDGRWFDLYLDEQPINMVGLITDL